MNELNITNYAQMKAVEVKKHIISRIEKKTTTEIIQKCGGDGMKSCEMICRGIFSWKSVSIERLIPSKLKKVISRSRNIINN